MPMKLDLVNETLHVDLRKRPASGAWQTDLDRLAQEVDPPHTLAIVLDSPPSVAGGDALVRAIVDALEVRGVHICSVA